jgi:hypothetical protein
MLAMLRTVVVVVGCRATRFYGWVKAGIRDQILAELQRQAAAEGELDWTLRHVDGGVIRAHEHAVGTHKGG